MNLVRVRAKGQITLPREIRRAAQLGIGDYLVCEVRGDAVVGISFSMGSAPRKTPQKGQGHGGLVPAKNDNWPHRGQRLPRISLLPPRFVQVFQEQCQPGFWICSIPPLPVGLGVDADKIPHEKPPEA